LSLAAAALLDDNDAWFAFKQISDFVVRNSPQGSELGSSVVLFLVSRVFIFLSVGRELVLQIIVLILATEQLDGAILEKIHSLPPSRQRHAGGSRVTRNPELRVPDTFQLGAIFEV